MTERQKIIYNFIVDFVANNGYSPTYLEICKGCYLSSKTYIRETLWRLEKQGFIKVEDGKHRAIKIVQSKQKTG